jgi:Ser/Thr protein kinase RdoA (MazF antagonist)
VSAAPYTHLTPDVVLESLERVGFACDGRILALASYENRVYQLGTEDGAFVVAKFYRPGRWPDAAILEEHAFALELAGHEIPVVAPFAVDGTTLHAHAGYRFAVFPRRGGRWPELASEEDRNWMGRFLGRMHAVGAAKVFRARPTLTAAELGRDSAAYLLAEDWIPDHVLASYRTVAEQLLDAVDETYARVGPCRALRIHGDCHPGNVLWTDSGPHFVDLDDCMMGPAVQDLWLFLSGEDDERAEQLGDLVAGYRQFFDFDFREIALIEALRSLRMLHYAAWIARRWEDPAFPRAFPWFGEDKYWEEHVLALKEQLGALAAPPLEVAF